MNTPRRQTTKRIAKGALFAIALAALALVPDPAGAAVTPKLSADTIGPGGVSYVTLEVEGSSVELPADADLGGLRIVSRSQQSKVMMSAGGVHRSVVLVLGVTADRPGTYRIGPLTLTVDGRVETTAPMTVEVKKGAGTSRPPSFGGGRRNFQGLGGFGSAFSRSPQVRPGSPSAGDEPKVTKLRLLGVPRSLTVGESEPVVVEAWFRGGTSVVLKKPPQVPGKDFVVERLDDEPHERRETDENGVPYTVLSWRATVRPIRAGDLTLAVRMPVQLRYRTMSSARPRVDPMERMHRLMSQMMRRDRSRGSMIDPSVFDDLFSEDFFDLGRIETEERTLSAARRIDVAPPPAANQPEGFTGAIGQFDLKASVDRDHATVGEPLTVTFRVEGNGSFDRIEGVALEPRAGLRTYAPSTTLEPGAKIFEQPVVPTEAGIVEIPPVSLHYFDPKTGEYESVASAPIPIEVAPSPAVIGAAEEVEATASALAAAEPYRPIDDEPWFAAASVGAGLLGLTLFGAGLLRRRRADPVRRRARQTSKTERALFRAAKNAVGPEQVTTACDYARARLGRTFGVEPKAVTAAELNRTTVPTPKLRALFEAEDALRYGRASLPEGRSGWFEALEAELDEIHTTEETKR